VKIDVRGTRSLRPQRGRKLEGHAAARVPQERHAVTATEPAAPSRPPVAGLGASRHGSKLTGASSLPLVRPRAAVQSAAGATPHSHDRVRVARGAATATASAPEERSGGVQAGLAPGHAGNRRGRDHLRCGKRPRWILLATSRWRPWFRIISEAPTVQSDSALALCHQNGGSGPVGATRVIE
jgi:hypothetical protein